ncbi:MAG: hypothetical protein ACOYUK_01595 [Patescibacteria group bacterium]
MTRTNYIPLTVVTAIALVAVLMLMIAAVYEQHASDPESVSSTASSTKAASISCEEISSQAACDARPDCYAVYDACPCYTANSAAGKCGGELDQCEACEDGRFTRCAAGACDTIQGYSNTNTYAESTAVDTSDWLTYENEEYQYSIQYPATYKIIENADSSISIAPIDGSYPYPHISVDTTPLEEKITEIVDEFIRRETIYAGTIEGVAVIENMAIGGEAINYLFEHNQYTYLIRGGNTEDNRAMFNTFSFLNDTSDWLTYENEEYGFSFQYPIEWGAVQVSEKDYRNDERSYYEGRGVSITFANNTKPNIRLSSSDYRDFASLTSYNGGEDLAKVCTSPGIVNDFSYCINKTVAGQSTFDRLRFDAPECSPMFIRESWLNIDLPVYKSIIISSILFTGGGWDCTSDDAAEWDRITSSELQRLINRNDLTQDEMALLQGMDMVIETFRFL